MCQDAVRLQDSRFQPKLQVGRASDPPKAPTVRAKTWLPSFFYFLLWFQDGPEEVDWKLYVVKEAVNQPKNNGYLKLPQIWGSDWSVFIPAGLAEAKGGGGTEKIDVTCWVTGWLLTLNSRCSDWGPS